MREAGRIIAEVFELLGKKICPGIATAELDSAAEQLIVRRGGIPVCKGYHGFPSATCISVNEEVIHGIPGRRVLNEGDIVSVDLSVKLDGFCADAARTFPVGEISPELDKLLRVTEECMLAGAELALAGNRLGDIGNRIQTMAEDAGFGVVTDYVGHGIGREMHEAPDVPNFGRAGRGLRIAGGMALAIEPMITFGAPAVRTLADGWTVVTLDGKPAAHYENTVAVTPDGPRLLTVL